VLEPISYGRRADKRIWINGHHAIIDKNTDTFYAFCTDIYQLVPHEVALHSVLEAVKELPEFGQPEFKIWLDKDLTPGSKMRATVKFPDLSDLLKADKMIPQFVITNSYDLKWKLKTLLGIFRLVCSNGLVVLDRELDRRTSRHIQSLDVRSISEGMKEGLEVYKRQDERFLLWQKTKVLDEAYAKLWDVLPFSEAEKEKIEALPEDGTSLRIPHMKEQNAFTVMNLYNVITQYASHHIKSEIRKTEISPIITSVFMRAFK
jgi:hypothetical protein